VSFINVVYDVKMYTLIMSITYSERVSVALGVQHTLRVHHSHLWSASLYSIFPHDLTNCTSFEKKKTH